MADYIPRRFTFSQALAKQSPIQVSQKKLCQRYFLNNSVKHWPTLIISGVQHHKETWRKRP